MRKGFAPVLVLVIIAVIVGVLYFSLKKDNGNLVTTTPSPIATPSENIELKTFVDAKNRFVFKYPSNLTLTSSKDYDYLFYLETKDYKPFTPGSYQVQLEVLPNTFGVPQVAPAPALDTPEGSFTDKIELIHINGFVATRTTYNKGGWENNKRYDFWSKSWKVDFFGSGDDHTILDQIVSTFKFTN